MLFWDADAGDLLTGLVCTNDPFLQQLSVRVVTGSETQDRYVAYNLLRDRPIPTRGEAVDETHDEEDESGEAVVDAPRPTKKTRVAKEAASEVDMATLIECGEDESVPLTYVPCTNGILKTGSVALYDGREFRVEKLVFEGRAKKAFAHLTSVLDEVCILKLFKK